MIVTLTGANHHAVHRELAALTGAFIAEYGDVAVERFDGEEADTARMRESLASLPFLSGRKLVILRSPGAQKTFPEAFADILSGAADSSDIIIYEPKIDKRSAYYKTL